MGLIKPFGNIKNNAKISTNGLMMWLDAGISQSYPGTGTTWFDISGNSRNLTLTNGPVFNRSLNGGALIFDGVNDHLGSVSLDNPNNQLTFEVLLNYTARDAAYQNVIDSPPFNNPMFWFDNFNWVELNQRTLTSDAAYNSENILLTATFSTTTPGLQLYLNGNLVKTTSTAQSSWGNPYTLTIFNRGGSQTLQATVYAIRAYNRILTSEEIKQNYQFDKQRFNINDLDALSFLTATSITDVNTSLAINTLVTDLKINNLWDKIVAIYPFVGGTATTHKFNLKNPVDTDGAFRLSFNGGITHDANGVTGNGTDAYYNTHILVNSNLTQNNASGFIYNRNNVQSGVDFGSFQNSDGINSGFQMNIRNTSNNFATRGQGPNVNNISNTDAVGFFGISRTNSSNYLTCRSVNDSNVNTVTFSTVTEASANPSTVPLSGLALTTPAGISLYSNRNHAMAVFGEGLTQSEITILNSINKGFQTTLGRYV